MVELPVRCCCQPKKILGWLSLPDEAWYRRGVVWAVREKMCVAALKPHEPVEAVVYHYNVEVQEFCHGAPDYVMEMAVYSEERPIEFWRNIQGFRENHEPV